MWLGFDFNPKCKFPKILLCNVITIHHMYLRTPEFNFVSRNIWLWINETSPSCVLLWKNSNVGWCNSTPFDLIFAWTTFLFQIFTSCCHRKWTKSGHFEVFFKITQLLFLYVYNSTTSYGKSRYLQAAHLSFRNFLKKSVK